MYQTTDLQENRRQIHNRLLALSIPLVLCVVGIIIALMSRGKTSQYQWVTVLLTILGGSLAIFCYSLFIGPVVSYGRHLKNVLGGRTRETTGILKEISSQACFRQGVEYYPMLVSVGDVSNEADDRLFYYDVHKDAPPFAIGDRVTVISHDKAVADIRRAEQA